MQKINKILAVFLVLFVCLTMIPMKMHIVKASEATVEYKDFNDEKQLNNKYSYGTLFWTNDTTITYVNDKSNLQHTEVGLTTKEQTQGQPVDISGDFYVIGGYEGDTITLKITNCAVDADGELCDVEVVVSNIERYTNKNTDEGQPNFVTEFWGEDAFSDLPSMDISLTIAKGFTVSEIGDNGLYSQKSKSIECNLMRFVLSANKATTEFSLTYYKTGTTEPANIEATVATLYDIDITNTNESANYDDELFGGNEGVISLNDGIVYYEKGEGKYLQEKDGGVCTGEDVYNKVQESGYRAFGTEGIAEPTSAMLLQNKKANYNIKYSGSSCGMSFIFVSFIPFEISGPTKSADVEKVKPGETFNYNIAQHIPNNYYAYLVNSSIDENDILYNKLVIEDVLDEDILLTDATGANIKVYNTNQEDKTTYFEIKVEGNKIIASVKEDVLTKPEFYNETFTISVPVKLSENTKKNVISNSATTSVTTNNETETHKSNIVELPIVRNQYTVEVEVEVENGTSSTSKESVVVNPGEDNIFTITITPNDGCELKEVTIDGEKIDISKLTYSNGSYTLTIKDENINENIKHKVIAKCEKIINEHAKTGEGITLLIIIGGLIVFAIIRIKKAFEKIK